MMKAFPYIESNLLMTHRGRLGEHYLQNAYTAWVYLGWCPGSNWWFTGRVIANDNYGELQVSESKSRRGFASMDPDRQREIARRGGSAVPAEKRSFSQNKALAKEAGRKGGETSSGRSRKKPA